MIWKASPGEVPSRLRLEKSEGGCGGCLEGRFQGDQTPSAKALRGKCVHMVCSRKGRRSLAGTQGVCSPEPTLSLVPARSDHTSSARTRSVIPPAWSPIPSPFSFLPIVTHCVHPAPSRVLWCPLQPLAGGLASIYLVLPCSFSYLQCLVPSRNSVKRQKEASGEGFGNYRLH